MNCLGEPTFNFISREDLDSQMLKMTLKLYNISQLSRKSVGEVIDIYDEFTSSFLIPFIQSQFKVQSGMFSNTFSFNRAQFLSSIKLAGGQ